VAAEAGRDPDAVAPSGARHVPGTEDRLVVGRRVVDALDAVRQRDVDEPRPELLDRFSVPRREQASVDELLRGEAALGDLAREADIESGALVNFTDGAELGGTKATIDERFLLDLDRFESADEYVASLPPKVRQNVRRWRRRAEEAGATVTVSRGADADLDGIVELARRTAAKYGAGDFYRPGPFQRFVRVLGDAAVAIEVRLGDRLLSGGVCLVDAERFHTWTCGVDYLLSFRQAQAIGAPRR
jgi:predicted N-acyltransferase